MVFWSSLPLKRNTLLMILIMSPMRRRVDWYRWCRLSSVLVVILCKELNANDVEAKRPCGGLTGLTQKNVPASSISYELLSRSGRQHVRVASNCRSQFDALFYVALINGQHSIDIFSCRTLPVVTLWWYLLLIGPKIYSKGHRDCKRELPRCLRARQGCYTIR